MDGEYPNVFKNKKLKANKEHVCIECQTPIFKGGHYFMAKGHWSDSGWQTFKTCVKCEDIRQEVSSQEWGVPAFGNLAEWAQEAGIEMPEEFWDH